MDNNIAEDLKDFVRYNIDSMVEDHFDVWQEKYYRKSKEQVESMLRIGYDFSCDIEYVESELNRELTDEEKEYFVENFTNALVHNFYQY